MLISSPPFPPPQDLDAFIDATVRTAGLASALATRLPAAQVPLIATSLTLRLDQLAQDLDRDQEGHRQPSLTGDGQEHRGAGEPNDQAPR